MLAPNLLNDVLFKIVFGTSSSEPVPGVPLPETLQQEEGIDMAIETMRKAYARDEVRELILMRDKALRDYESGLATAHETGREEGREEGREANKEEVARRMLARGAQRDFILEVTGLSEEKLTLLEQQLNS